MFDPNQQLAEIQSAMFKPTTLINPIKISQETMDKLRATTNQVMLEYSYRMKNMYIELNKPLMELSKQMAKIQSFSMLSTYRPIRVPILTTHSSNKILNKIEQDDSILEEAVSSLDNWNERAFYLQPSLLMYESFNQILNAINVGKQKYPKTTLTIHHFSTSISEFYEQIIYNHLFSCIFGALPQTIIEQIPLIVINLLISLMINIAYQKHISNQHKKR